MERLTKAVHVTADKDRFGEGLLFLNGRFDCKVSAKDTCGDLCVYDTIRTKKGGPPLHFHHAQDEWFFVRDGEFLFRVGDDTFQLKAGDSILGPRKVPHVFANISDAGKLMIVYQPAGIIEQFFLDGSRLTNPTQVDWQALYRAHVTPWSTTARPMRSWTPSWTVSGRRIGALQTRKPAAAGGLVTARRRAAELMLRRRRPARPPAAGGSGLVGSPAAPHHAPPGSSAGFEWLWLRFWRCT